MAPRCCLPPASCATRPAPCTPGGGPCPALSARLLKTPHPTPPGSCSSPRGRSCSAAGPASRRCSSLATPGLSCVRATAPLPSDNACPAGSRPLTSAPVPAPPPAASAAPAGSAAWCCPLRDSSLRYLKRDRSSPLTLNHGELWCPSSDGSSPQCHDNLRSSSLMSLGVSTSRHRPRFRVFTVDIFSIIICERCLSPFSASGRIGTQLCESMSERLVKGQMVRESMPSEDLY